MAAASQGLPPKHLHKNYGTNITQKIWEGRPFYHVAYAAVFLAYMLEKCYF
jgi:hypothetical protein